MYLCLPLPYNFFFTFIRDRELLPSVLSVALVMKDEEEGRNRIVFYVSTEQIWYIYKDVPNLLRVKLFISTQ